MMNLMFIDPIDYLKTYKEAITKAMDSIKEEPYEDAYNVLHRSALLGKRVFVCGNGGSASIAEHFSCDHEKGVRTGTGLLPQVISLSSNMAKITAIGNDIGFEHIFSTQLAFSNANSDDTLVVVSSSGNSPNILKALEHANRMRMRSIALVGFDGGEARNLADYVLHVNSGNYGIVEDCHQIIMHSLAQALRVKFNTDRLKL